MNTVNHQTPMLRFSSYHLVPDPDLHVAGYGARLLIQEVRDGSSGVVYDRQDAFGPRELVETEVFPVLERWYTNVRQVINRYGFDGSDEVVELHVGRVHVVGSPQQSYGYLYVTALLDRQAA